jgi:hypothetical protein
MFKIGETLSPNHVKEYTFSEIPKHNSKLEIGKLKTLRTTPNFCYLQNADYVLGLEFM